MKELKSIVDTEVNKHYGNDKYYLTRVMLSVDKEHKGEILFYFIEKKHKNPKFLKATVDTALGRLLSLEDTGRNDLEAPYEIYVNEWMVDSQEAYQIAQARLQHKSKEVFDGISIMTENFNKEENWYIQLYNPDRTYWCEIDPYTGTVLGDGIRDIIK